MNYKQQLTAIGSAVGSLTFAYSFGKSAIFSGKFLTISILIITHQSKI